VSWGITQYVWDQSGPKGNGKLVLLALADFANKGGVAWPSILTLARKTGLSPRQVQRLLRKLEVAGDIKIEDGGGRKRTHRYTFPRYGNSDTMSPFNQKNGDNLSKKGDTLSPEPLRNNKKKKGNFDSQNFPAKKPNQDPRRGNGVVL